MYARFDAVLGRAVPYVDTTPHVGDGLRVLLRSAVAGGAFVFGAGLVLPGHGAVETLLREAGAGAAICGSIGLAVKMVADGLLELGRQAAGFAAIGYIAPVTKPAPAAAVLLPATPDSAALHPLNAARDMRIEVMRLLNASIDRVGPQSSTIPRHTRIGWSSARRAKAVAAIAPHVDVDKRGTVVRGRTLAELVKAVSDGTVKPMAVSQ